MHFSQIRYEYHKELYHKQPSCAKFAFQTKIKTEVALVEPPLFKAPPDAVIFTGSAHPMKFKQAS
jgi:hypothetical protein